MRTSALKRPESVIGSKRSEILTVWGEKSTVGVLRAVGGRQTLIRQRYRFDTNRNRTPRRPRNAGGEVLMRTSVLKESAKSEILTIQQKKHSRSLLSVFCATVSAASDSHPSTLWVLTRG